MKYDFTRCNNLAFRAKDDGNNIEGFLKITKNGAVYVYRSNARIAYDSCLQLCYMACYTSFSNIDNFCKWAERVNFEIVPRDPETYTDWKVGDKIEHKDGRGSEFVIKAILGEVFFIYSDYSDNIYELSEKCVIDNYKLILTDYEQELLKVQDEKKEKECPFQEGDRVLVRDTNGGAWIFEIFNSYEGGSDYPYDCKENVYKQCIPFNEKTWKLLGTTEEYKEE